MLVWNHGQRHHLLLLQLAYIVRDSSVFAINGSYRAWTSILPRRWNLCHCLKVPLSSHHSLLDWTTTQKVNINDEIFTFPPLRVRVHGTALACCIHTDFHLFTHWNLKFHADMLTDNCWECYLQLRSLVDYHHSWRHIHWNCARHAI